MKQANLTVVDTKLGFLEKWLSKKELMRPEIATRLKRVRLKLKELLSAQIIY